MVDLVEFLKNAGGRPKGELHLRPDPERRPRRYRLISVDDHLIEPPHVFEGRMPSRFAETAPRVVRDDGVDWWIFGDERVPLLGADAIQSWEPGAGYLGPLTFDELRPGTWDIHERIRDMDVNGVLASLNFPSAPFGFAGQVFMRMKDPELGLASMMAFNDWIAEEWSGSYPDRIIPCQVTWLADPSLAAAEVERNAARGFKAVSFSENPWKLGLPSIHQRHWDPFLRACEETGTVINLHVGSSSETFVPGPDSLSVLGVLFPANGFSACADWLYAGVPARFPDIRIAMSEGGIGWVPMLLDRIEYTSRYSGHWHELYDGLPPAEVLGRNFWFTTFSDPRSLQLRHEVGIDRIMFETDYPHSDSSWPDTQDMLERQLADLPADDVEKMTWQNAAALYRHPLAPAGTP